MQVMTRLRQVCNTLEVKIGNRQNQDYATASENIGITGNTHVFRSGCIVLTLPLVPPRLLSATLVLMCTTVAQKSV